MNFLHFRGKRRPFEVRFWEKVAIKENGCWLWIGAVDARGYGAILKDGKIQKAHRLSYEIAHGPAGDLLVLHRCDNPPCVNPQHLFAGTDADNMADMRAKGRANTPRGESVKAAKLTERDIWEMRHMWENGISTRKIAAYFPVNHSTVYNIVSGKKWAHVTGERM